MSKKQEQEEIKSDIKARAIGLIKTEKNSWENGTVYVTDRVAFNMRSLIKQLRKNYWGIFTTPLDRDWET